MDPSDFAMPSLSVEETKQRFSTMRKPERLESSAPEPGSDYSGLGYWYWMVAGRLFMSSFRVEPGETRAQREQKELKAWRELLAHVDGLLPERLKPPVLRPRLGSEAGEVGPCQIADGGLLPRPESR